MVEGENEIRPKFFVSSALKDLIGRELVSNKYIAVFELVKNSYDAGAKEAHIIFKHREPDSGGVSQILIYDDGIGMSKKDIMTKWLFIGYSDKKESLNGLVRMSSGYKGIGRFSCDRLGVKLDMYTKTEIDSNWNHLAVNWLDFERDQNKKLETIELSLTIEDLPEVVRDYTHDLKSGTFLLITGVRDEWPYDDLFTIKKYLQRMVNPYEPISDFRLFLAAPAYIAEDRKQEKINEEKENADDEVFERWSPKGPVGGEIKNAVIEEVKERSSWIRGCVEDGKIRIQLFEGKDVLIETKEVSPFNNIGMPQKAEKVEAEIFYLNRNAKNIFTRIMGVRPVDFGSIHVYRNAFRVLPYGEAGNDWLQLDLKKAQGFKRLLSTRELLGRVSISDKSNTFREVASREGFYEGQSLSELKEFLLVYLIRELQRYVVEAIGWNSGEEHADEKERKIEMVKLVDYIAGNPDNFLSISVGPNLLDIVKEKEIQKIPQIVESLESLAKQFTGEEQKEFVGNQLRSLKRGVRELNKNIRAKEKEIVFLEKSTEGGKSPMLDHEIIIAGNDVFPALEKVISELRKHHGMGDLIMSLESVRMSVQKMVKIAELSISAKFSLGTDFLETNVTSFVTQYLSVTKKDFLESNGVNLEFIGGDVLFQREIPYLDLVIIIDNLASNSVKAHCKNITVKFEKMDGKLKVLFSDDGEGVTESFRDKLFLPGESTRGGTGLGLYSLKKFALSMGGEIRFLGNSFDGLLVGACFEVII